MGFGRSDEAGITTPVGRSRTDGVKVGQVTLRGQPEYRTQRWFPIGTNQGNGFPPGLYARKEGTSIASASGRTKVC